MTNVTNRLLLCVLLSLGFCQMNFAQEGKSEISVSAGINHFSEPSLLYYSIIGDWIVPACDVAVSKKTFISPSFFYTMGLTYNYSPKEGRRDVYPLDVCSANRTDYEISTGLGYNYNYKLLDVYVEGAVGFAYVKTKFHHNLKRMYPPVLSKNESEFEPIEEVTNAFGLKLGADFRVLKHLKLGLELKERYLNAVYFSHSASFKVSYVI